MPAQVASGPTMLRVGERSDKDKKFAADEYVYADPGVGGTVVVAPRPRGEAPSMENAAKAVLKQLGQYPKGTKGTYLEAASGAVIAKLLGKLGQTIASGETKVLPGMQRMTKMAEEMIGGLEAAGGMPRVIPSATGAGEIARQVRVGGMAESAPSEIRQLRNLMTAVGVPESGIEGLAATGPAMEAMPRLEREIFQAGTGVRQTGARTLEGAERLTRQQAVEKFARSFGEAETPLTTLSQGGTPIAGTVRAAGSPGRKRSGVTMPRTRDRGPMAPPPKIRNYEFDMLPARFKGFLSTDGTMFGVDLNSISVRQYMEEPHHDDITIAMGIGKGGRGGVLTKEGTMRVATSDLASSGMSGNLLWLEAFDAPNQKQLEYLAQAAQVMDEIEVSRAHRGKTTLIDMLGAVFPNWEDGFTLHGPVRPTTLRAAFAELFPEARMAPGELAERAGQAAWDDSEWEKVAGVDRWE